MSAAGKDLGKDSEPVPLSKVQSTRILLVDYAKGFGIFLVVLGHTLRGLVGVVFEPSALIQVLDQWLYAFHMPLFFFLSGLFIERSVSKSFGSTLLNKLKTIAYPYFVWSILQELVRGFARIRTEPLTEIWTIIHTPVMQFWFLYALFFASLLYVGLRKLNLSISLVFLVCFLLFVSSFTSLNLGSWSAVYLVRMYAIYFVLGALVREGNYLQNLEQSDRPPLIFYSLIGFGLVALAAAFDWTELKYLSVIFAVLGIFATLAIARYVESLRAFDFLKTWGALSLEIFVAHTIFSAAARVILQKVFNMSQPGIHILVGTLVGIFCPILLYQLCLRCNFPYLFRFQPRNAKSS